MKFLHIMLRVRDIEKSLRFYRDFLEMEVVKTKRLEDCTLYFLSDKENQVQIELTYNDDIPEEGYEIGNGFGHLAFGIEDMNNFIKRLNQFGYNFLYEPYKLPAVSSLIAFIRDPDGYEIEIIEKKKA